MNARFKAAIAAAVVGIAGLAILSLWFGASSWLLPAAAKVNAGLNPRVEMMPGKSPEYLEKHFPGANGADAKVEIQYRNGDSGIRLYRPDGSLKEWNIEFKQGGTRLHAEFAADGKQVLMGYELRDDRSFQWRTASKNGSVETTTFYFDGKSVFSKVEQKIGDWRVDTRYFRKSGKPWFHKGLIEEFWDKEGNQVYRHEQGDNDAATITYFRADGTAAFRQSWAKYSSYGGGEEPGGEYYPTSIVLKSVEEFAKDGNTVVRLITNSDDGTAVSLVTEFSADGSKTIYTVNGNLDVTQIEKHDKDGKVETTSKLTATTTKIEIAADRHKAIPSAPLPTDFWTEQEKNPTKRANDAP